MTSKLLECKTSHCHKDIFLWYGSTK